jgi:hypothetical protein
MNNSDHQLEQARAMRTAKQQIEFIMHNIHYLKKVDKMGKYQTDAKHFQSMFTRNEEFTPNQLNYIDGLYEKTMKGAGLPSVNVKQEKRHPAKLRF